VITTFPEVMLRALAMPLVLLEKNYTQNASWGSVVTVDSDEQRAANRVQAAACDSSQRRTAVGKLSLAAPAPAAAENAPKLADVLQEKVKQTFVRGDIEHNLTTLKPPRGELQFHVYVSPHNAGATEVIRELTCSAAAPSLAALKVTSELSQLSACALMLVYLRADTWDKAFAAEVYRAMQRQMPLLMVHEQPGLGQHSRLAVPFGTVIVNTPRALKAAKIYSVIASPLKGNVFRPRSLLLLSEALVAMASARPPKGGRWKVEQAEGAG